MEVFRRQQKKEDSCRADVSHKEMTCVCLFSVRLAEYVSVTKQKTGTLLLGLDCAVKIWYTAKKDQKADIDISREGKKMKNAPAYVKVYSRLKNEINKGTYPVGGFLPKECELEKIYQVSRTTVRNAVKDAGAGGTG